MRFKVGDIVRLSQKAHLIEGECGGWWEEMKGVAMVITDEVSGGCQHIRRLDGRELNSNNWYEVSVDRLSAPLYHGWMELDPFLNAAKDAVEAADV